MDEISLIRAVGEYVPGPDEKSVEEGRRQLLGKADSLAGAPARRTPSKRRFVAVAVVAATLLTGGIAFGYSQSDDGLGPDDPAALKVPIVLDHIENAESQLDSLQQIANSEVQSYRRALEARLESLRTILGDLCSQVPPDTNVEGC